MTRTEQYQRWIADYLELLGGRPEYARGRCRDAVRLMRKEFPELVEQPGWAMCAEPWGKQEHWWCKAPDGSIVDPTACQFPLIIEYVEYKPGDAVRLGKCMQCGSVIEGVPGEHLPYGTCVCSDVCLQILEEEFNGERRRAEEESASKASSRG